MLNPNQAKKEFQVMLERWHYDIWLTITFGVRINEYEAVKNIKYFFKNLNKPFGTAYYDNYMYCWLCAEKKPWHDRVHVHSLIQRINPVHSKDLQVECEEHFGEARAKPYNPALERRATEYLAEKYACGWLKTYDFFKINSRWRNKALTGNVSQLTYTK